MMKHTATKSLSSLAALSLLTGLLVACNWVDSTGRQSNTKPTIVLDDGTPADGFSLNINEQSSIIIDPSASSDDDGRIVSWSWGSTPTAAGALDFCANVDGFNSQYAANSLREACTDEQQCELSVVTEEVDKTEEELAEDTLNAQQNGSTGQVPTKKTVFTITTPQLKAPIGLTYRITAKDNDGGTGDAEVGFCLIAINEAPQANDDAYTVIEGVEKVITANDAANLLSNDIDDIDVTNQPLSINAVPLEYPQLPQSFYLGTDGSFNYYYPADPTRPGGEEQLDSFVYEVTDGIHVSQARVNLRVVTVDDPPVLTADIPDQTYFAGITKSFDFRKYFHDPEGATLTFSEETGSLPASFDRPQLAQGKLTSKPTNEEIGQYNITLAASDGNTSIEDSLLLTIVGNKPPVISNIPAQTGSIGQTFSLDIAKYASDTEKQPLTYSISGNPAFLSLKGSVIQGKPTTTGSWDITVSVSDGFNAKVSKTFKLTVVNSPPTAKNIPDQSAGLNQNFSLNVSGYFSDPDGQKLSYSISGSGASYVNINSSGVISGKFTKVGTFTIKVTASDGAASASSDFDVKVNNPSPVLKSDIPDKTTTAGDSFTYNVSTYFSDPNGDSLTFSASGLPGSLSISGAGIISGATTLTEANVYSVKVTASDGTSSVSDTFKLTVNSNNTPPKLVSAGGSKTVTVGQAVTIESTFSDSDPGDALTITANLDGSGLSFTQTGNTGKVSGTASKVGTFNITVTATDKSKATASDSYVLKVEKAPNSAPTLVKSGGGGTYDVGQSPNFVTTFKDDDGDKLEVSFDDGGSGLKIGQLVNNSVTVSGTLSKAGTFTVKVTAKDPDGASVTDNYTVKVNTVNSAPSIVKSGGGGTYDVGQSPSFVTTFKDDDGDKLEVSFDDGGSGLKIGQLVNNSVTVSGTLSKAGTFTVKVTAKDPDGASVTDSYTVKVIVVNVNSPPEVDKSGDGGTFTAGTKVSFLSRFKDDDNDPLEISANTGGSGLTMEEPNNNNAVAVSGTLNQIGTFTIKVTAKDLVGGASVTDSYIVKVDSAGANTNP